MIQKFIISLCCLLTMIHLVCISGSKISKVGVPTQDTLMFNLVYNNFLSFLEKKLKQKVELQENDKKIVSHLVTEIIKGKEIMAHERPDIWYLRQG